MTDTNTLRTRAATAYAMAIAATHADSNSSAKLCLSDARACYDLDDMANAYNRSVDSLAHSVGRSHADYLDVSELRSEVAAIVALSHSSQT